MRAAAPARDGPSGTMPPVTYVEAGIRTWYDVRGEGDPLVLLHPGGFDSRAMEGPATALAGSYTVYLVDRRGHGRTPDVDGEVSFAAMADDTAAFLDAVVGGPAHVVGHSDGAIVGLHLALRRPDLVRSLVFSSGVWHHTGWLPGVLETPDEVREWSRSWHDEVSPDGPGHFAAWEAKLDRMHRVDPALTVEDLRTVTAPTLVTAGDDDEMPLEHLRELQRAVPGARLGIVPGAGHGAPLDKPAVWLAMVTDLLESAAGPRA
jgi:pimeloyl-ACP methyl ester carboxylesterase